MSQTTTLVFIVFAVSCILGCDTPIPESSPVPTSTALPAKLSYFVPDAVTMAITLRDSVDSEKITRLEVADAKDLSRVVTTLRSLDWSQEGVPLNVAADMRATDIDLQLIDEAGKTHRYSFYWSGDALLVGGSARLLTVDVSPLRALVSEIAGRSE